MEWGEHLKVLLLIAVVVLLPIFVIYFFATGGEKQFALRPLRACFEGMEVHESLVAGDVKFVYHTYRGFLLWFETDEHQVFARPDVARKVLGRLLRFNLTWGLLCEGGLFVLFLAVGNYMTQRYSIDRQEADLV